MNKILVINNKIENIVNEDIEINNNIIKIINNCDITIEYIDCSNINNEIIINPFITSNIFEISNDNNLITNNNYILNESSKLNISKFYNNKSTIESININLNNINSSISYNFSNIASNNEYYKLNINHNSSNTISNITNNSITLNNSIIELDVNSNLPKGNTNCILNQDSKVITMGPNKSIIKPNMYISEPNVTARHSSSVGEFNEDDIFYLQSRGIEYNECIKLLIKGFLFKNINVNIENREKILKIFNKYWR